MKSTHLIPIFVFCGSVGACGGGSDGPVQPPPQEPPPALLFGGFWLGTMSFESGQITEEYIALVTEDGQFRFLSATMPFLFSGVQATNDGSVSATGQGITDLVFLDGTHSTAFTAEGTLVEREGFSGAWSTTAGDAGTFDFSYDPEYERPSSLALLEGVWSAYDDFGSPVATFTFDPSGTFNGQNVAGCSSLGDVMIADGRYNVYLVNSTISGCGIAGDYSGMAALADVNGSNDAMVLTIDDGSRAILLGLQK